MTLQELGVHLSTIRQGKALSIKNIANVLKLSPRVIEGMENADLNELPPAAYARAFYRSYAKMLAIDEELIRSALDEFDCEQVEEPAPLHLPIRSSGRRQRVLIFLFVLVMAIFAGIYTLMSSSMLQDMSSLFSKPKVQYSNQVFSGATSPGQLSTQPISTVSSAQQNQLAQSNTTAATNPEGLQTNKLQTLVPLNSQKNTLAPLAGTPRVVTPIDPTLPLTPPLGIGGDATLISNANVQMGLGTRHILMLTGLDACWVKVTSDGAIRQFSMQKGQTLQIRFDNNAVLLLGSAGAVRARLDGRVLPPLGRLGEVRTVTFPTS